HHVGAEVARSRNTQNGIHVRAVEIDQSATGMQLGRDIRDLSIEEPQRIRIRNHENRDAVVELGLEIRDVDESLRRAANCDRLEARYRSARGVGTVGAVRDENLGALFTSI